MHSNVFPINDNGKKIPLNTKTAAREFQVYLFFKENKEQ